MRSGLLTWAAGGVLLLVSSLVPSVVLAQETQQPTPPIAPHIQEVPLPPPVTLPQPASIPPDVPNTPLTADEAAQIALRHQPAITVAAQGVNAAAGRVQQERSGLLPQIGVGAGYSRTQSLGGTGSSGGGTTGTGGGSVVTLPGYQASANLRQLVFDFNHTRDLVRQAIAQQRAASAGLTVSQANTVLQVKQAFYTYVQNERLVAVNETNVRDQQAHLAEAQARLKAGVGLPSDVVRAETAVDEALLNLNVAQNGASTSRVALALAMGIDPRTPINAAEADEQQPASTDMNTLVATAIRQRPEVIQAREFVAADRASVSAARTTNAPSLSANLGVASRGTNFPPGNSSWNIGASIQWNPFDSGLTAGVVRQAQANLAASQADLASTQLTVTSDVSQAYLNLRTAEQRVTTAGAEVANAQESARLAEGRYRAGVGTFIEITDAQAALLTAQTNQVNARNAVDQARAALARAIGAGLPAAVPPAPSPGTLVAPTR